MYSHLLGMEEEVGELDERALVRWIVEVAGDSPNKIELQHLIRNVRRAQWSTDRKMTISTLREVAIEAEEKCQRHQSS